MGYAWSRRVNKVYNKNCNHKSISTSIALILSQAKSFLSLWVLAWYAPYHCGTMLRNGSPKGNMPMMRWSSEPSALGADAIPMIYFGWTKCLTCTGTRKPLNGYGNRRTGTTHRWKPLQTVWCRKVYNLNRTDMKRLQAVINQLENSHVKYTADDVNSTFHKSTDEQSLFNFMQTTIVRFKQMGKIRTAENYSYALKSFAQFRQDKDIPLSEWMRIWCNLKPIYIAKRLYVTVVRFICVFSVPCIIEHWKKVWRSSAILLDTYTQEWTRLSNVLFFCWQ